MKKFALMSVSDKTGITELAKDIEAAGYGILATGNTAKKIAEAGVSVTEISDFTGFPEVFDGRVKTLHPKVFAGLLMRRDNEKDQAEAEKNDIATIDIVCVNLYPFQEVAAKEHVEIDELIENIDIGGPSLIRASAKNNKYVSVLTNPDQYEDFVKELKAGEISEDTRKKLALAAFCHTAEYDTFIANTLEEKFEQPTGAFRIHSKKIADLRYGENPHQSAAMFGDFYKHFENFHGKELSYNNILDLVAAVEIVEELEPNSCAIIKHNNPSGAATASNIYEAYEKALQCDPVSAFGGIVSVNDVIDEQLAAKLNDLFLEVIVAPGYTDSAIELLQKKKNRRLVKKLQPIMKPGYQFRAIPGGVIRQTTDVIDKDFNDLIIVTGATPTAKQLEDLKFAWIICKHVKSNTIVFVKDKQTLGVGAGQVSRIDSVKIAALKAKEFELSLEGSVAASDAFFPFPDALLEIVKHGAQAIIQPGGSVKDDLSIEAADKHNIAMVFTGIRHFKH